MSHLIAPSILTADFLRLEKEIEMINESQADWVHLDIMDGVFVPNLTFGFHLIRQIRDITRKPLDAHLMIVNADQHLEKFLAAGADKITVHVEACTHLHRTIQAIKSYGMDAGVALNPHTPVSVLEDILPDLDLVLIMTVNPGFGGQEFIENSYKKIRRLREMINHAGAHALIQIDGGVNEKNILPLKEAGVDCFVVGNTIFGAGNPLEMANRLKNM